MVENSSKEKGKVKELGGKRKMPESERIKNLKTIRTIMLKVKKWDELYKKVGDRQSNFLHQSLEAANRLDTNKKTLDDYFQQIKNGVKYKFDFEKNADKKFTTLRKFVEAKNCSKGVVKKKY